ncbi:MAG: carbon-nitrogen hydrolase family protein [Rhodospirillaceae bacterium]|nr:carbon-nitrogen hydrolase family protein [Rhodospirillaceae bacterium]
MTRVAAIQMTSGRDVAANLDAASALLAEASGMGAQLLVLPENFAFLAADDAERLAAAERWGGGAIQTFLRERARALGAWLVGGTIALWEDAKGADSRRARAASLLVDPRGEIRARYDKIHLFDVGLPASGERYRESASTSPGTEVVSAETDVGRIGMAVCYDLRFPALFDRLGVLGAEILALPAAFTVPTGEAHWRVLVRARAIETLAYVVAAAQCGEHAGGRLTYGHSIIVDPWGAVLAERAAGPGVVMADLDMMRLQRLRERFPALQHRRTL